MAVSAINAACMGSVHGCDMWCVIVVCMGSVHGCDIVVCYYHVVCMGSVHGCDMWCVMLCAWDVKRGVHTCVHGMRA